MPGILVVLPVERDVLANVDDLQSPKMHHVDELVFNKLAELMDFSNGEIGFNSSISTHWIASELTETMARKASRNRASVDRAGVRRSIDRLIAVGLFERHSEDRKLKLIRVYWRDFVSLCKTVKNPDVTADVTEIDISIKKLSLLISCLHDYHPTNYNPDVTADVILHKPLLIMTDDMHHQKQTADRMKMSLEFEFDSEIVRKLVEPHGFDCLLIDKRWTSGFQSHWWSEANELTFAQWHDKYARRMCVYFKNPTLFDELNGGSLAAGIKPKLASVKPIRSAVAKHSATTGSVDDGKYKLHKSGDSQAADPKMAREFMDGILKDIGFKKPVK